MPGETPFRTLAARAAPAGVSGRLGDRWWVVPVLAVGASFHALAIARIAAYAGRGRRPPLLDSIIFEYVGWYLTVGGRLYVDVWEVKPPLPYETTALLALFTGDVATYHWLAVGVTSAAALLVAVLVGALVHERTGDAAAAAVAGTAPFAFPAYAWRAALGFKAKYFVLLFGLLAVYLSLRERPFPGGLAAGASVGYWQFGIVFPLVVAVITRRRDDRRGFARAGAGVLVVLLAAIAPVIAWGALDEMVVETLLVPLIVAPGASALERAALAIRMARVPTALLILGGYGAARAVRAPHRPRHWWVGALAGWFALQSLVIDLDAVGDLLPAIVVAALGIGVALGTTPGRGRPVAALLAVMLPLSALAVWGAGVEAYGWLPAVEAYDPSGTGTVSAPYGPAERRYLFWESIPTDACRTFYGRTQHRYLARIGRGYFSRCGALEPALEALLGTH